MAVSDVADLTVDELRALIRDTVRETILELLDDPDLGLELRDEFELELRRSLEAVRDGEVTKTAQEVAAELGLNW